MAMERLMNYLSSFTRRIVSSRTSVREKGEKRRFTAASCNYELFSQWQHVVTVKA